MWKTWTAALLLVSALPCPAFWLLDGRPETDGGGSGGGSCVPGTFPVLRLELGGRWCDYEIKASTNNFASLVYYYVSSATNGARCAQGHLIDDPDPYTYYTDDHATDVRKWQSAPAHTSIYSRLVSPSSEVEYVYFYPSHSGECPWASWMSKGNTKLVWSFVRFDGVAFEMNASGTAQHWNPVRPEEWEVERTVP